MAQHRFYTDLAPWWPLISPVADYADEAEEFRRLLEPAGQRPRVLELGAGGGHLAYHLKAHVELTLTDLSEAMLAESRRLNPECRHLQGDMRTLRLGETFDAVLVHDAIDYLTSEADLAALAETARVHCRPGGIVVLAPDHVRETFEPSTDCGGSDSPDGRGVRYLEWSFDPDPADTTVTTEYVFLVRHADGRMETVSDTHVGGLFPIDTWLRVLEDAAFTASVIVEQTDDDREPRRLFVGRRANAD